MKAVAFLSVLAALCLVVEAKQDFLLRRAQGGSLRCIAYEKEASIDSELTEIAETYDCIRTYNTNYDGKSYAEIATKYNLKVLLGLNMDVKDIQLPEAIEAAAGYPDTVVAILIGNECIPPLGPITPEEISEVAEAIRGFGVTQPLGTSQRQTEMVDPGTMGTLKDDLDFLGVNIYPFYSDDTDPQHPMEMFHNMWTELENIYGKKLMVTETGWPTECSNPEFCGESQAQIYFDDFYAEACAGVFPGFTAYFMFYNAGTKASTPEGHFGLMEAPGQPKIDITAAKC